jgi:hypothetical protein
VNEEALAHWGLSRQKQTKKQKLKERNENLNKEANAYFNSFMILY